MKLTTKGTTLSVKIIAWEALDQSLMHLIARIEMTLRTSRPHNKTTNVTPKAETMLIRLEAQWTQPGRLERTGSDNGGGLRN